MNCQAIQNQILALPDPRELPATLGEHVTGCAGCQAWSRQAARLESLLEQLPVPPAPTQKKEAMIGDLMQVEPVIHPMIAPATRPSLGLMTVRLLRRNATAVSGLAAAVLVAIGVFSLWPGKNEPSAIRPTQRHPLLEKIIARDTALARADSPAKRLETLNGMANDLSSETRGMARIASGAELKQMAGWYEKVVKSGMVKQAERLPAQMPASDRVKLLEPLAARLNTDATEAEKLSHEVPPDAQPALKRIAETAREGEKSLRALARGSK